MGLILRLKAEIWRWTGFGPGAETERLFRKEIEELLPADFEIVRASRLTESSVVFEDEDKPPKAATDYEIIYKKLVIAAIEVTTGSEGYSYETSKQIWINEDKLERMERYTEGFLVMRILVGEPHFMWARREDIRRFPVEDDGNHWTDIKIWKPNLNGLVALLIELAEREDKLREMSES